MTELSREELRAHLSAVEAQVRAALRIVAAESKSVQQAHSALRADLSAALIRLQSEMNDGTSRLDNKLDRVVSDVNNLGRQRRLTTAILTTLVLLFGMTVGLLAGGSWYVLQQSRDGTSVTVPMESLWQDGAPAQSDADSNGAARESAADAGAADASETTAATNGADGSGASAADDSAKAGTASSETATSGTTSSAAGETPPETGARGEPSVRILSAQ